MALREVYPELRSTQERAVELARCGAEDGSVVVARQQSHGRGRGDRRWESPPGGLYLSVVLRPALGSAVLPLAIGAEVADGLALEYGVRLRLKWPNDLLAVDAAGRSRKLAGVLVDGVRAVDGAEAAVAGIGVNVRRLEPDLPAELLAGSVALEELTGTPVDLERLEAVVTQAAVRARKALAEERGSRSVVPRVRGLLYGVGEEVTADGVPVGTLLDVREDGALEVGGPGGIRAIFAGDVRVGFPR